MDLEQIKSNKTKMILRFSIPSIISMILTSLITIADGFLWEICGVFDFFSIRKNKNWNTKNI